MAWEPYYPSSGFLERGVGSRKLWVNVLLRSALDTISYRDSSDEERKVWTRGALAWISSNYEGPQSFRWVCGVLDLPPEKVRKWVTDLAQDTAPRARRLDQMEALVKGALTKQGVSSSESIFAEAALEMVDGEREEEEVL